MAFLWGIGMKKLLLITLLLSTTAHAKYTQNNARIIHFVGKIVVQNNVKLKNYNVNLGYVNTNKFKYAGDTSDMTYMDLVITDPSPYSGAYPHVYRIKLTINGSPDTDDNRYLKLSSNNTRKTAKGLGIGFFFESRLLPINGMPKPIGEATFHNASETEVTERIGVAYTQTGNSVSPGIANGIATITVSYQ